MYVFYRIGVDDDSKYIRGLFEESELEYYKEICKVDPSYEYEEIEFIANNDFVKVYIASAYVIRKKGVPTVFSYNVIKVCPLHVVKLINDENEFIIATTSEKEMNEFIDSRTKELENDIVEYSKQNSDITKHPAYSLRVEQNWGSLEEGYFDGPLGELY